MSLITFTCAAPVASWSPSINPAYGSGSAIRKHQPIDISDGGDVYSYNHGESGSVHLQWGYLPTAELTTLLTFFSIISGAAYKFTYTDMDGVAHTALLANADDGLDHRQVESNYHEVSVDLEVS